MASIVLTELPDQTIIFSEAYATILKEFARKPGDKSACIWLDGLPTPCKHRYRIWRTHQHAHTLTCLSRSRMAKLLWRTWLPGRSVSIVQCACLRSSPRSTSVALKKNLTMRAFTRSTRSPSAVAFPLAGRPYVWSSSHESINTYGWWQCQYVYICCQGVSTSTYTQPQEPGPPPIPCVLGGGWDMTHWGIVVRLQQDNCWCMNQWWNIWSQTLHNKVSCIMYICQAYAIYHIISSTTCLVMYNNGK